MQFSGRNRISKLDEFLELYNLIQVTGQNTAAQIRIVILKIHQRYKYTLCTAF
jgi:hypothetical protein